MLAKVFTGTNVGLEGTLITVEVDIAERGFPTFTIVGLPGKEVNESKDRVRTALANAGFQMPDSRLTVNLAPADIPKVGSCFDLPIAVGILAAQNVIPKNILEDSFFIGELSLEGNVRPVSGVMPLALLAREKNKNRIFVSMINADEAAYVDGITVYAVNHILDVVHHAQGSKLMAPHVHVMSVTDYPTYPYDFADVRGQQQAKRALEIAAAGFHNVHLKGVPGAGKTLLSRSFPSILPPLEKEEILEVTKIYSIVGMLEGKSVITQRPFRAPHHTTSRIGLIGGGSSPTPGEISLAHRGVLFLDEFPEFDRGALESLRQPLEDGIVTISRAAGSLTFPARFLLLSASNPCPCGYLGHPTKPCTCGSSFITRYKKRLSGPILDRIDIHVDVPPVEYEKLTGDMEAEPSSAIRARVIQARGRQRVRLSSHGKFVNAEMTSNDVKKYCTLADSARELLKKAAVKLQISARSYFKIVKIAQTIADLEGSATIEIVHISEALQYRPKIE